jgi:outer membrane protein TolC
LKKSLLLLGLALCHAALARHHAPVGHHEHVVWFPVTHESLPEQSPLLSHELSLEKALDLAAQNRSILYSLTQAVRARKASEQTALADYLPQISFKTLISQSQKQLSGQLSFKKHQQFFNFDQLLYSFAGPLEQYRINQYDTNIAQLQRELKQDAVQFEVEKSFLTLSSIQHKSSSMQALACAARAQFARATGQNNQQLLNTADWYKEIASYTSDLSTVDRYQEDVKKAECSLERALEVPEPPALSQNSAAHFIHTAIEQAPTYPLEFFIDQAYGYRKELAIKDEEIAQGRAQQRFYQRSYLPKFSFFTIIENGAISVPSSFWLLGIQISWEFDGLADAHRAEEKKASVESAILAKKDTEQTITLEVQTAYYDLQKLLKQLRSAYKELERDRELFITRKKQYEIGELSAPDFASAQKEWETAQFTLTDLETNVALKQRELLYSCGYPRHPQIR